MKQPVEVREHQCMLQGEPKCEFVVRRLPSS
jgi:predicted hydrocarbon binding protein